MRFFGDLAIIRGTATVTAVEHGTSHHLRIGYTDVWVLKDKQWRMTAWRSARLPESPVK
jgi:hypothetical protein